MADSITLRLTHAEALVFFEWLARNDEAQLHQVVDPAEQTVIWRVESQLETALVEIVLPDYGARVERARKVVGGQAELACATGALGHRDR